MTSETGGKPRERLQREKIYQEERVINYVQGIEQDKDWEITIAFGNMEAVGKPDKNNYSVLFVNKICNKNKIRELTWGSWGKVSNW